MGEARARRTVTSSLATTTAIDDRWKPRWDRYAANYLYTRMQLLPSRNAYNFEIERERLVEEIAASRPSVLVKLDQMLEVCGGRRRLVER